MPERQSDFMGMRDLNKNDLFQFLEQISSEFEEEERNRLIGFIDHVVVREYLTQLYELAQKGKLTAKQQANRAQILADLKMFIRGKI